MRDFLRLLRAWATRRYRVVPWRTLGTLALVGVYAVSPVDLIPDVLPGVGVIDDAAMLGLLVRSLMKDTHAFLRWEEAARADGEHS